MRNGPSLTLTAFALFLAMTAAGCASFQESMFDAGIRAERSMAGMHEGSVTAGGRTMSYIERPGPGETIVLVHGFGADKDNWPRFVRHMPKEYRVIAIDLPGHGQSFRDWQAVYTIDFITQGLADAVDGLKLDKFHLAGNSMGGWVSVLYASRHADRVITLGLFDTAGTESPVPSDRKKALDRGENVLIPTREEEFSTLLEYAFHKRPFLPWPATTVLARRAVRDAALKQKIFDDISSQRRDIVDVLPELHLPVLVIWGA
ncbi:MAG TPA: alpha/beta fold hydrolase, partial [Deltaproteobacteria bacterium]|nr:alpha/beta fold hydrolase [Deltaproteobacteria bacterium]